MAIDLDSMIEKLLEGGEATAPRAYVTIELTDGTTGDMPLDSDKQAKSIAERIERITGRTFHWYEGTE